MLYLCFLYIISTLENKRITATLFWSPGGSFTFKNYMLFHLHEVLSRKSETVFRMVVVRVEGIDGFGWTEFQFYKMKGL